MVIRLLSGKHVLGRESVAIQGELAACGDPQHGDRVGATGRVWDEGWRALVSEPFAATSVSTVYQDLNFVRSAQYAPSNDRLTLGPMVELRLPRSFAVEVSALYRRIEYMSTTRVSEITPSEVLPFDATLSVATEARDLDFPVLVKYRFSGHSVQPFLGVGGAARWVFDANSRLVNASGPSPLLPQRYTLNRKWSGGYVVAAGLEWRLSAVRIAPELRYFRWASPSFQDPDGKWLSPANQLDSLLSVGF